MIVAYGSWTPEGRSARRLALAAFLAYLLAGGGRIVGSDELAMFHLGGALLRGSVAVPEGATLRGADGRHVTKNAAGQAVMALPWIVAGEGARTLAARSGLPREAAARAVASTFNAAVCAALLGTFYWLVRRLGAGTGAALAASLLLGFATPVWVYAKSFMAEPLQALGLLLAAGGTALALKGERSGETLAAEGVLIAVSVKLPMALPAAIAVAPLVLRGRWLLPAAGFAVALLGHGAYNLARFGTPLETGYGTQATAAAYTTPLLVGLYGLLLSSGKGLLWFAPPVWLAFPAFRLWLGEHRATAVAVLVLAAATLAVYSTFEHWAGDGSFGPRYLLPVLPVLMLPVPLWLSRAGGRAARAAAWGLGVLGVLVQLGGVGIYFGAQMRERGDYPYTLPLSDPRFMSESHWNPRFSPIADHWRMLRRNLAEHLAGQAPRVRLGEEDAAGRTGLEAEAERALLRGLDFWWAYALYAGLPRAPVLGAAAVLLVLLVAASVWLRAALRAESGW